MQDNLHPDRLLDRPTVEQFYGVSQRYLEVAATRGDGPTLTKIGRLARYRVRDIVAWLDAQRVE